MTLKLVAHEVSWSSGFISWAYSTERVFISNGLLYAMFGPKAKGLVNESGLLDVMAVLAYRNLDQSWSIYWYACHITSNVYSVCYCYFIIFEACRYVCCLSYDLSTESTFDTHRHAHTNTHTRAHTYRCPWFWASLLRLDAVLILSFCIDVFSSVWTNISCDTGTMVSYVHLHGAIERLYNLISPATAGDASRHCGFVVSRGKRDRIR